MTSKIIVYSDGGADPNPGIGGWAAILKYGRHEKVLSGSAPSTTNNRMELTAAIEALAALKRPSSVEFYTDSQYLRKGISEYIERWVKSDWKTKGGKPISNVDLWQRLYPLVQKHDINWHWVKGHSGEIINERVDALARQARLEITPRELISADIPRLFLRSSCKGNPGPGGWGVVLETSDETEQNSGSEAATTNNRMELMAAIEGLLLLPLGSDVQVFTTSDYVFQGATRWIHGWRHRNWQKRDGKPVANADLWQALDKLQEGYAVRWINAKGLDSESLQIAGKLAADAAELS
ncbi:MAG: ribonuclease HI [Candidatus Promineifilaceae bacterium]|nr:ribonuclease HI [Candidatus Promineifilaceae bacterium]